MLLTSKCAGMPTSTLSRREAEILIIPLDSEFHSIDCNPTPVIHIIIMHSTRTQCAFCVSQLASPARQQCHHGASQHQQQQQEALALAFSCWHGNPCWQGNWGFPSFPSPLSSWPCCAYPAPPHAASLPAWVAAGAGTPPATPVPFLHLSNHSRCLLIIPWEKAV